MSHPPIDGRLEEKRSFLKPVRHQVALSSCELSLESDPLREPPRPLVLRHADYEDCYDFTTLVYDCFWNAARDGVVFIGPPDLNLPADLDLSLVAQPSRIQCERRTSASENISRAVADIPIDTTSLLLKAGENAFYVAPQPNLCELFRGRRVITTLNKDNDPQWIRDWIVFHQKQQGCDGVLLYDNSSTRYSIADLYHELSDLCAELPIVVVPWPFTYGVADWRRPLSYKMSDSHYCQLGMMEHARWRFLAEARSVLNVDIDELVLTSGNTSVFELVEASYSGHLVLPGKWVELHSNSAPGGCDLPRHRDYFYLASKDNGCRTKWAAVPAKIPDSAQWHIHRIVGMPAGLPEPGVELRHFKAINTEWIQHSHRSPEFRTAGPSPDPGALCVDRTLQAALDEVFGHDRPAVPPPGARPSWSAYRLRVHSGRLAAAGQWTEAIEAARSASRIMPDHSGFHLYLSELLDKAGYPVAAERHACKARVLQNENALYHVQKGRQILDDGDVEVARRCFETALEIDPSLPVAYHTLVKIEAYLGRPNRRLSILEACLEHVPEHAASHALYASELSRRGRISDALKCCEAAITCEPTNPHFYLLRARLLRRLGRHAEAKQAVHEGLSCDCVQFTMHMRARRSLWMHDGFSEPVRPVLLAELAEVMIEQRDFAAAEAAAREALVMSRAPVSSYRLLARVLRLQGNEAEAQLVLDRAVAASQRELSDAAADDEGALSRQLSRTSRTHQLAQLLRSAGRCGEALAVLKDAVANLPHSVLLRCALADVLAEAGDSDEAEQVLRTGIARQPEVAELHAKLSVIVADRDLGRAIEAAQTAIQIEPDSIGLRARLAKLQMQAGTYDEAERNLIQVLACEADSGDLHYRLSQVLERLQRLEEATHIARRAVHLRPQSTKFRHHLAAVLLGQGLTDQAEATLQQAIKDSVCSGATYYRLSRLLRKRGCLAEAVEAASSAVRLEPGKDQFQRNLAGLIDEAAKVQSQQPMRGSGAK